jgi:signal transduction histidine kinase
MSHELRTPLNHILGFTELVLDKKFGELNETQMEYLSNVHSSSKHLLSLLNDILDLSKVEAGKLQLETSAVNVKALLEDSLIMVKEKALKHGITLSTNFDSIPETVAADERKLRQIIYNFLSNAVKFTSEKGGVHVTARKVSCKIRPGLRVTDPDNLQIVEELENDSPALNNSHKNYLEVSVTDTGIGLNQEDLKRIFNRFEQIDGSKSRKYTGTGLGLSLTKSFVEMHGGKIWAESKGKGQGSTFRFVIPI